MFRNYDAGFFIFISAVCLRLIYPIPFLSISAQILMFLLLLTKVRYIRLDVAVCTLSLAMLILIGNFYTMAPNYGLSKSLWIFSNLLLMFLLSHQSTEQLNKIKNSIELVAILFFPIISAYFLSYLSSDLNIFSRFDANEANPIILSQILLILAISILVSEHKSVLKYGLFLGYLIMSVMTGSKGPILGLCLALFLVSLRYKNTRKVAMYTAMVTIIFCSLGGVLLDNLIDGQIYEVIQNRYFGTSSENSVDSRLYTYLMAVDAFVSSGILGICFGSGVGSFGYLYHGFDSTMYPHNILFEAMYENGLVFVLLFFGVIIWLLKHYFILLIQGNKYDSFVFMLGCVTFMISMVTGDLGTNLYLYIFLGLAIGKVKSERSF
ncbi:TPA: O-antigen ligase family protein [Photobacterium damselae]